jgi:DnaJ-class molecular chaperone
MPPKNYYQILQVDPSASPAVIEAAYKRLAKIYHPDVNRTPAAATMMQQLNVAYQVLRDPAQRRQYDQQLKAESERNTSQSNNSYT